MKEVILVVQIAVSIALSASILLQARGGGLGMAFGEGSEQYRSKRGVEKVVYRATVILTALFFITSIVNLLVQ